jgi:tRNA-(ms[2]io[6]A)-hydroxylase
MSNNKYIKPDSIQDFLLCKTPQEWVASAIDNQEIMLIDHAHCEVKAASSAMSYIYKHPDKPDLLNKMSRIAREEMVHFEQVMRIMQKRNIIFRTISASRYASSLIQSARTGKEERFIDSLIIGSYIEARSCERFSKIAPFLDVELQKFYNGLLESEKRHFTVYLGFAEQYSSTDITGAVNQIGEIEKELILSADTEFRFHSGVSTRV